MVAMWYVGLHVAECGEVTDLWNQDSQLLEEKQDHFIVNVNIESHWSTQPQVIHLAKSTEEMIH